MIETPHEITLIKTGEPDAWGEPSILEEIPLKGNIRSVHKLVRDDRGEEVVANFTIVFRGYVDVKNSDKIRFVEPNGVTVETHPIQVKFMRDFSGSVAFTKVVM